MISGQYCTLAFSFALSCIDCAFWWHWGVGQSANERGVVDCMKSSCRSLKWVWVYNMKLFRTGRFDRLLFCWEKYIQEEILTMLPLFRAESAMEYICMLQALIQHCFTIILKCFLQHVFPLPHIGLSLNLWRFLATLAALHFTHVSRWHRFSN